MASLLPSISTKFLNLGCVMGCNSSKVSFFDHLLEETKIRIDNHQNIILVTLIFINALIKKIFKVL